MIPSGSDKRMFCQGDSGTTEVFLPVFERARHGGPRPWTVEERIARFWARVDIRGDDECWPWLGGLDQSGYGLVCLGKLPDGRQKNANTHRVAYLLAVGPIPEGLVLRHSCDNPRCCNFKRHLIVGTQGDNIGDAQKQGKYAKERPGAWVIEPELRRRLIAECLKHPPRSGVISRLAREHGLKYRSFVIVVNRARKKQQQQRREVAA